MTETLTFPGLGLSFELSRVAFWLGQFPIYWYGITFASAFLLGLLYFHFNAKKVGIHPYEGLDALLWAIIGGVIGARLYFVVFQWDALYKANPMKIFAFREGGLAIYGGVIGAVLVGWLACKLKKLPMLPMMDVGLPALLLGQAIGRWGNFFNVEAFGGNTTQAWGMTSKGIEQYLSRPEVVEGLAKLGQTANPFVPVHPTFFYEFLWNLLGFLLLAFVLTPRRKYDGQVTLAYIAWYGLGRAFIEGLRTDSLVASTPWGMIRVSQWLGVACVVAAVLAMLILSKKARSENRPAWMGLYAESPESAALMARGDAATAKGKKNTTPQAEAETPAATEPEIGAETATESEIATDTEPDTDTDTATEAQSTTDTEPQENADGGDEDGKNN